MEKQELQQKCEELNNKLSTITKISKQVADSPKKTGAAKKDLITCSSDDEPIGSPKQAKVFFRSSLFIPSQPKPQTQRSFPLAQTLALLPVGPHLPLNKHPRRLLLHLLCAVNLQLPQAKERSPKKIWIFSRTSLTFSCPSGTLINKPVLTPRAPIQKKKLDLDAKEKSRGSLSEAKQGN